MGDPLDTRNRNAALAEAWAMLKLKGVGIQKAVIILRDQFKDLTITRSTLAGVSNLPSYREIMVKYQEDKIRFGKLDGQVDVINLMPEFVKALQRVLKSKNPAPGIAVMAKVLFEAEANKTQQAQQLQIIMPAGTQLPSVKRKPDDKA